MGKTRYSVEGLNLDYLIEKLHKNEIDLSDIDKESSKRILFSVKNSDVNKLVALLKNSCYNIETKKITGKPRLIKFLLNRAALFIGLIVFIFVSVYYGTAVRDITYLNDAAEYSESISGILSEENVKLGSRNIDTKALSNKILSKIPDLVFVSVNVEGINLSISAFKKNNLALINENIDVDIISDFDGVITRMYVLSGTPLVKTGDKVVKGQTLIKGTIGPEQNSAKVLAVGEVYGITNVIYTEYFDTIIDVPFRTGNSYTINKLTLFNMSFPAKSETAKNFLHYEKKVAQKYLFEGMILPFQMVKETYYEVDYQKVERNFDKISSIIIGEAQKKALALIDKNLAVQDNKVAVTDEENRKLITITILCEKKISVINAKY